MPLVGQVVDVKILPPNQEAPTTSAPVGRIKRLVNKVAKRFEGQAIKVEARDGFQQATMAVRDVTTGALISPTAGVPNASLLSSLQTELVAISGSHPHVLAEDETAWSKFPYVYSPTIVKERPVWAQNVQVANPDGAAIGGVFCRTWSEPSTGKQYIGFFDADGTPIRQPRAFQQFTIANRAKVVADGTYFWVVYSQGISTGVTVFDTHGEIVENITEFTTLPNGEFDSWDVTFSGGAVLYAQQNHLLAPTAEVTKLTISGTTITVNTTTLGFVALGNMAFAWAESTDSNAYLLTATSPTDSGSNEYAFRLDVSGTPNVTGYFSIPQTGGSGAIYDEDGEGGFAGVLCEMSGIVRLGVLYAQLSFFDSTDVRKTRTVFLTGTIGTTAVAQPTVRSVMVASRVFQIESRDVVLAYYPSADTVVINNKAFGGEPTFFLLDVVTRQVCGRFNAGSAGMEWPRLGYPASGPSYPTGPYLFCLPHVFAFNGITHVPTGFQARTFNQTVANGDVNPSFVRVVSAVGYQDLEFGGVGQAIEFGSELLMPGAVATSFDGLNFSENNLNLAPAQPQGVATSPSTGHLTPNGRYEWIVVFSAITRDGDRILSATSIPLVVQLTTTIGLPQDTVTLTGFPLHMTTRENVTIAIYRNVMGTDPISGAPVPSTLHYRVDNPLQPLLNDPNALTWTFVDGTRDSDLLANEVLYTDQGFLQRDPMPSFSVGTVWQDRAFCVGPDNAIWYSAEKAEGDSLWFSTAQRIPAFTTEPVKNLVGLDGRLVAICEGSIWAQTAGGFPGPTGVGGNVQPFVRLPFTNGGTGFALYTAEGIVYSSTEGGVWLITRGLENRKISGPGDDDLKGRTIHGLAVDGAQRLHASLGIEQEPAPWGAGIWGAGVWGGSPAGGLVVLDALSGVWSKYEVPTSPDLLHTFRGRAVYTDTVCVMQASDSPMDSDLVGNPVYVTGLVKLDSMGFAGIKKFQRVWSFNIQGETIDSHTVTMTAIYDEDTAQTPITETWTWSVAAGDVFSYEFQPKLEQCESISLSFSESFPDGGSGKSFTLEALGFYVAVDQGLARVPLAKRIQST